MINNFSGQYSFLSNFYHSPIEYNNLITNTVEHAFQASKTTNNDLFKTIMTCSSPKIAKRLGRSIDLRSNWEEIKIPVMRHLIRLKFAEGEPLADKLVKTGDHILIEDNTWNDYFWGQCHGMGDNWLGFILMARRAELRGV